jgi:hypothetical protein
LEDVLRIDQLVPGDQVTLGFCSNSKDLAYTEPAVFLGHGGEGSGRTATFEQSRDDLGGRFEWTAYIGGAGWSYGSAGNHLRLMSLDVPMLEWKAAD